jgi:pyrroloquinoline quinone biosynthesis protein B
MSLRALIIGAAAGGGLPQWNCAAPNSRAAWDDPRAPRASQSSLAVSADGDNWALINASPDLRAQLLATPALQPRPAESHGLRNSPLRSVLVTNGDIDHVAGLLTLREGHVFDLFATEAIHEALAANSIFNALDRAKVARRVIGLDAPFDLMPGLRASLYAVPGKVPLYLEGETVETGLMGGQTVGVALSDGERTVHYVPGCARMTDDLASRLDGADAVLFDGTVFHDDEMIRAGVGPKTGARMGHIAMAGPEGSLAAFEKIDAGRRIYVHINNTNPVWNPASPERATVAAAGWEVGQDGMEIIL